LRHRAKQILAILAYVVVLAACGSGGDPTPIDLGQSLCGTWADPSTGWVYHVGCDGRYSGDAPQLADGTIHIQGALTWDTEGFVELSLAQQMPRRPFQFYVRSSTWQAAEVADQQLLLVCGRTRVRLLRRAPCAPCDR